MSVGRPRKRSPQAAVEMPTTRRSAGSPRKRTGEAIEAAAAVFAERGFHGATTQDIADRLQIRQATLYYYFPSKEVALELVCQRGVEGFIELAQAAADSQRPVQERLRAIVEAHLQSIDDKPNYVRTFLNERQHLPDPARKRVGRLSRRYERIIQQVIESGMQSGELRPDLNSRLVTLGVLALCNTAAAWYGKEPGTSVAAIAQSFGDLIWRGVCAPGAPAAVKQPAASLATSGA